MALTGYEKPIDQYSKNELVEIAKNIPYTIRLILGKDLLVIMKN
jgi:hypothetical protein